MDNPYIIRYTTQKDVEELYNLTKFLNVTSLENIASEPKAMGLGAASGILIAIALHIMLSLEYNRPGGSINSGKMCKIFSAKNVSRTLSLTLLVLMLPIVFLFLLAALVYKVLCSVAIRRSDQHFIGFLDSFDVFWTLEDDATKSIINVLGIIEAECPNTIAEKIKVKLRDVTHNESNRKIFYRRGEDFGFFYWKRNNFIDMNQYVEIVEFPEKDNLDVENLEDFMSNLQDQPLPYENEGLFKIIITKQRIGNCNKTKGDYGIIFRIHHSVGDGVALIEFLCQTFADNNDNGALLKLFTSPKNCNSGSPRDLIDMMIKLIDIPLCFVNGILREPDSNRLHGPSLCGKKVFKWTQSDENLLKMVKDIKDNIDQQLNFSDVLMTALSSGLREVLSEVGPVPEDIAVILPVRFPKILDYNHDHNIMKNDFSVSILDVPVKNKGLCILKKRCNALRNSAEPLTNYYFLKLVCSALPKGILQPLLISKQASLVFSNLPGPNTLNLCDGNVLKSLVFFAPNKGTTGVGVTALGYGGVLRFGAMADASVSNPQMLEMMLNGMVKEIRRLHQLYATKA